MKLEDKLSTVSRLIPVCRESLDATVTASVLKAVFDCEELSNSEFALNQIQPLLVMHLENDPEDADTTEILCKLFAYCI